MPRPSHTNWPDNLDNIFYGAEPYSTIRTQIVVIHTAYLHDYKVHVFIPKYVSAGSRYWVLELLGPERTAVTAYILTLFHLSIKINGQKRTGTSRLRRSG
jgi:hypothetical protein